MQARPGPCGGTDRGFCALQGEDGLSDALLDLLGFGSHRSRSALRLLGKEGPCPQQQRQRCRPGEERRAAGAEGSACCTCSSHGFLLCKKLLVYVVRVVES